MRRRFSAVFPQPLLPGVGHVVKYKSSLQGFVQVDAPVGLITLQRGKGHWSTCGTARYLCGPSPTGHMSMFTLVVVGVGHLHPLITRRKKCKFFNASV